MCKGEGETSVWRHVKEVALWWFLFSMITFLVLITIMYIYYQYG